MYALLDELHINKPSRSKESFYAVTATKEIAEKLEMKKCEALLVRKRVSYDHDGQCVRIYGFLIIQEIVIPIR